MSFYCFSLCRSLKHKDYPFHAEFWNGKRQIFLYPLDCFALKVLRALCGLASIFWFLFFMLTLHEKQTKCLLVSHTLQRSKFIYKFLNLHESKWRKLFCIAYIVHVAFKVTEKLEQGPYVIKLYFKAEVLNYKKGIYKSLVFSKCICHFVWSILYLGGEKLPSVNSQSQTKKWNEDLSTQKRCIRLFYHITLLV